MSQARKKKSGLLINGGILFLGLLALVLIYAFVTRYFVSGAVPHREGETDTTLVGDIIQVEVLNGTPNAGLAGQVRTYLRDKGFDVVEVGNYTQSNVEKSFVIDRVGNLASAQKVAQALGIAEAQVKQTLDPDLYLDTSVILGQDYRRLTVFQE